jgi:hypothetical protein
MHSMVEGYPDLERGPSLRQGFAPPPAIAGEDGDWRACPCSSNARSDDLDNFARVGIITP